MTAGAPFDGGGARRSPVRTGPTGRGDPAVGLVGLAVAVQTTGPDLDGDVLFELSLRRFVFDADGVITAVDEPCDWLEDPGSSIPEDVARFAGVDESMLAGRRIDDPIAWFLLRTADLVVAWGAEQVRPWVEKRLPEASGRIWACARTGVDWAARGTTDGGLVDIADAGAGGARRAGDHVDGLFSILNHVLEDGRTALAALLKGLSLSSAGGSA